MKKRVILVTALVLFGTTGICLAENGDLGVDLDFTWLSRNIWRGFDVYGNNHSAMQPSADIDWYGTGFGTKILWSRANSSGFENCEELDFTLYYGNTWWQGQNYTTDYRFGWTYYTFPDQPSRGTAAYPAADMQEVFGSFSWPEICPAGIVPSYTIIRLWPSRSDSHISDYGGWMHIFGLGYDWSVPGFLPNTAEQVFHLSAETVYNDGITRACRSTSTTTGEDCQATTTWTKKAPVDHDWSHAVFGISTDLPINNNLTFIPAVYYQSSWDDSVNSSDEYWVVLYLRYNLPN